MTDYSANLNNIADAARSELTGQDVAREKAMPLCREAIRNCSLAIRAVHRQDFNTARKLASDARKLLDEAVIVLNGVLIFNKGFLRDSQKELAEANTFLSFVTGKELPSATDLGIGYAAYLNGLAEAVGELRRYILDKLRQGDSAPGEQLLSCMDDIYSLLITIDFPDAISGGLRRNTDIVRGILEKTRSDLTLMISQKSLENRLDDFEKKIN